MLLMMKRRYRNEEWLRTGVRVGEEGMPFEVHHRRACARWELRLKHLEMVAEAGVRCGGPATVGVLLTFELCSGAVVGGMIGICVSTTPFELTVGCAWPRYNFMCDASS